MAQTVHHVPGPNEKVTALGIQVSSGGPAANAAVTAAALGCRSVFVTALGSGPLADLVRVDLPHRGVAIVDFGRADTAPPVSTVLLTAATGDRAVVSMNAIGAETISVSNADFLDDIDVALVDGHHLSLCLAVAQHAASRGIPVILDGGSWKPGMEDLLLCADIALLSADFMVPAQLLDDAGDDDVLSMVSTLGPFTVVQSHGADAIVVLQSGLRTSIAVPAYRLSTPWAPAMFCTAPWLLICPFKTMPRIAVLGKAELTRPVLSRQVPTRSSTVFDLRLARRLLRVRPAVLGDGWIILTPRRSGRN